MAKLKIKMETRDAINGYLFFSPWLIGFIIFLAGPIIYSAYLSFTSYNTMGSPKWIGTLNYEIIFTADPMVWKSLYNTIYYIIFSVPLNTFLGLLLAVLLNQKVRGIRFFRTVFYLPNVVSGVAVLLLWQWLLDPNFGLVNTMLSYVGIEGPGWLQDPSWSKPSLIFISFWNVGGGMIIYLAGLQGISRELYEAATVDGASKVRQFWRITIPMMTPTILFNLILGLLGGFQVFMQAYIMTGGGPVNSTMFYALYLYNKAFRDLQMGYASALAWILLFITLIFTLIVLRNSRDWVHYDGADRKI
jgi:multiple sugar transport system permease protein